MTGCFETVREKSLVGNQHAHGQHNECEKGVLDASPLLMDLSRYRVFPGVVVFQDSVPPGQMT